MLQSIRDMSKSWIFKGLMAFLVISFGIWGIGDMFRGNPRQREVARVGNVKIPVQQLEFQFKVDMPEARQVFGPELTEEQARKIGVLDRTLNMMIERASFDQEAARLGLVLDDTVVLKELANDLHFRDQNGKFNAELWHRVLGQSGLTERMFLDHERQEMVRRMIYLATVANATPPQIMIDALYRARGAKRILEIVSLRNDAMKDIAPPSDSALEDYYKAHETDFTAPEYRSFTVARLMGPDLTKDVAVSDDDVKKAYEERLQDLKLPERRDLLQVVFQDEAKAKAFYDSAKETKDLAAAAKTKGLTAISLNKVDERSVLPDLFSTAFALQTGEISEPIKSQLGWHVVQVKKIYPPGDPSFEEIKESLRQTLLDERTGDLIAKTVNQMDDNIAAGKSLEDMADALKLRLDRFPAVDAKGRDPSGKAVKGIPYEKESLQAAFGQGANETGQIVDDKQGNYYVVRTDEITASRILPLDDVKAKVMAAWLTEQKAKEANQQAEDIAQALRDGKPATSFASKPGVDVRLSKPISILENNEKEIPAQAILQIYRMQKGDVIVAPGSDRQYILRLADIVPVNPKKPEASRAVVVEEMNERLKFDLLEQYSNYLHKVFPVKIDAAVLNTLKSRGSDM